MNQNYKAIKHEYNAGFNDGLKNKQSFNNTVIESGINSNKLLIKVYWKGYYDAVKGYMRNEINYGL